MYQNVVNRFGFTLLFFTFTTCFALQEDRTQIMQLSANAADLNQQTHQGVYSGAVQLDQGTTHVRCAEAITEGNEKNQLVKAIIKGDQNAQAHYWTDTALNKPPLHAYADIIYYYPERHLIELVGHATIEQGTDSFSAPKISYDTLHQHVLSETDKTKARTTIIFRPEKKA